MVLDNKVIRETIDSKKLKWNLIDNYIERQIEFKDFDNAFNFMTKVAALCKVQNHHPYWINDYNQLIINLHTIEFGGVSEKDLILAEAIDAIPVTSK